MKTILQKAAETIDRLGRDAQDCKSCDYKWQYADIAEKIYNPEEQDDEDPA